MKQFLWLRVIIWNQIFSERNFGPQSEEICYAFEHADLRGPLRWMMWIEGRSTCVTSDEGRGCYRMFVIGRQVCPSNVL